MRRILDLISRRPVLALCGTAFFVRAACAAASESFQLFPSYYFSDAHIMDAAALQLVEEWRGGAPLRMYGSLSQTAYAFWLAALYRVAGHQPLLAKLLNAGFGALAVWGVYLVGRCAVGRRAALAGAAAVALWPSHVFFTSQNFRDAPTMVLLYLGIAALVSGEARRSWRLPAAGVALIAGAGVFRSYYVAAVAAAGVAAYGVSAAARALKGQTWRPGVYAAVVFAATVPAFVGASRLIQGALRAPGSAVSIIPGAATATPADPARPLDPESITRFRQHRQEADRRWSRENLGRDVGTQLFPDAVFRTWLDVLLFVPKGTFYALFMPLPGLYPIDGKVGRALAAGENTLLLLLCAAAVVGVRRSRPTASGGAVLLFMAGMAVASGLLDFDLGSVTRHKITYLALVFPYAFAALLPPEETA